MTWALDAARKAYAKGPEAAGRWCSVNPPKDVTGPPCVYRVPCRSGDVLIDGWLVDLFKRHGDEHAIAFIAIELFDQKPPRPTSP